MIKIQLKRSFVIEFDKTSLKDLSSEEIHISVQANDEKSCFRLFERALEKR
jgi:hypothetical protein